MEAATLAGKQLLSNFRQQHASIYGAEVKSVSSRTLSKEVTSTNDHEADKIIIDHLRDRCPDHDILTEETGEIENNSPYKWIIDPLDGSSNFLNHNPFFAVSICLAFEGELITGVIFAPFLEELVVARRDQGCTVNGRPVRVSDTPHFKDSYIVGCPGGDPDNRRFAEMEYALHSKNRDFRKVGSAAIEAYMVAAGRVDAFTTLAISPWDVAAGALATVEAGGRVTDFEGNDWKIDQTDLIVSNGAIHDEVLQEIQNAGISTMNSGQRS